MTRKILILGAGPAGLSCAYKLLKDNKNLDITIVEREPAVGGIAASFNEKGLIFDYGSHRLHPATAPHLLNDIRELLKDDLLDRPRDGRIRLLNRFVKFPLKPFNFLFKLPISFFLGIFRDMLTKPFINRSRPDASFKDVLEKGLGRTICRHFYFPYAEKLWGLPVDRLSVEQARRRVAAGSIGKIIRKVLSILPFLKTKGAGRFYYPKKGFGQIFSRMEEEIRGMGGKILFSQSIEKIHAEQNRITGITSNGTRIGSDFVFSTIPADKASFLMDTGLPDNVKNACESLRCRSMVFCYLVLNRPLFTSYDAHYFPESGLVFSRLSEPKNYACAESPQDKTGLCLELPCSPEDGICGADDEEIIGRVLSDLSKAGLPAEEYLDYGFVKRLDNIYPVYDMQSESNINTVTGYLDTLKGFVSLGRQGLFVHDNTHHTMDMGYKAADCLKDGDFDYGLWEIYREEFKTNIVED
ncbi:MAG: FAD-dependent oxidoreductase [Spirochaetales bacterium]|nr:FAD-dependent oxidoreductase [Spirochaetales bacterium]